MSHGKLWYTDNFTVIILHMRSQAFLLRREGPGDEATTEGNVSYKAK